jgi:citrate lyase synthetase
MSSARQIVIASSLSGSILEISCVLRRGRGAGELQELVQRLQHLAVDAGRTGQSS